MKTTSMDPAILAQNAAAAASLLKMIANEHRLLVLCQLIEGEHSAADLLTGSTLSQSALSQHLSKLREHKLVATRRDGLSIYYSIADPAVTRIVTTLAEIYRPAGTV